MSELKQTESAVNTLVDKMEEKISENLTENVTGQISEEDMKILEEEVTKDFVEEKPEEILQESQGNMLTNEAPTETIDENIPSNGPMLDITEENPAEENIDENSEENPIDENSEEKIDETCLHCNSANCTCNDTKEKEQNPGVFFDDLIEKEKSEGVVDFDDIENTPEYQLTKILKILAEENNYSHLKCSQHLKGQITNEALKAFYVDFQVYGVSSANDNNLLIALKNYFELIGK